jgi:ketohexokinase
MPPLSAVLIPAGSGHRTIIHHRDTPEYGPADFARLDLSRWRWAHFESRPGDGTALMLRHARLFRPDLLLSIEAEKVRPGVEQAFSQARLVLFSRGYAEAVGCARPEPFLRAMRDRVPQALLTVTWGAEGAGGIEVDGTLHHAPAAPQGPVVDTLGAGDTFNAGMVSALAAGRSLRAALDEACALAGRKVGQVGLLGPDDSRLPPRSGR